MSTATEGANSPERSESPVCPYCGHSTWYEGMCWNPWCDGGQRERKPIVDVNLPED